MMTMEKNVTELSEDAIERLESCTDTDEIDGVFDEIGVKHVDSIRNGLLMKHMGVLSAFSSCDIDIDSNMELQYCLTKEIFIDGDWKYMSERD